MEAMEKNFMCIKGEAIGIKGNRALSVMYFPKDPACMETARMLVESGLCLALRENDLPSKDSGGFWSPAAALGDVLLERLAESGTFISSHISPVVNTVSYSSDVKKKW